MTIIKSTTKKGQTMINKANYSEGFFLTQVYENASPAKYRAWDYCYRLCQEENGENFHIISHNTFSFSVAWFIPEGVRIETANNSYLVKIC